MADRFPSLEDFSEGTIHPPAGVQSPFASHSNTFPTGQTDVIESKGDTENDFLARERAALGEDADQFATPQDRVAEGIEGEDDLLGGGEHSVDAGFESSFPSIETQAQNEV